MATTKTSVTLETTTLRSIRELVGERGVSSFLETAAQDMLKHEQRRTTLLAYLAELQEANPPTPDEITRATKAAETIRATLHP